MGKLEEKIGRPPPSRRLYAAVLPPEASAQFTPTAMSAVGPVEVSGGVHHGPRRHGTGAAVAQSRAPPAWVGSSPVAQSAQVAPVPPAGAGQVLVDEEALVVVVLVLDEVELLVEVVPLAPPLPPLAVVAVLPPAPPVLAPEPPVPLVAPEPPVPEPPGPEPPADVPPVEVLCPPTMVVQPRVLTRAIEAREPANRTWCMTAGLRAQGRAFSARGNAVAGAGPRG
jgi:hypothetical protein